MSITPDMTADLLRRMAYQIDSCARPSQRLVVGDIRRLVAALVEDDFDESKIRTEPRYLVYWDWDQKAHDGYLDYHSKMPDDPWYFFRQDTGLKPAKTLEEAQKWVKKKKLPGVEGKDWMIVKQMYDV